MGHSQWVGLQVHLAMASLYVLYVGLCLLVSPGLSQLCPTYEAGFTGQNMYTRRYPEDGRVYMNLEERSPCGGTVYGWHYCFDPDEDSPPRDIVLAMYSQREDNSYQLVPGSYYELRVTEQVESFTCRNITLEPSEYFSVQEGDVVAICRDFEISNVVELYFEVRRRNLWYWEPGLCSETAIDLPNSNLFRIRDNRVMLLSAYININECELGVHTCHENANCTDVVGGAGSFSCNCNPGYTGNGTTCVATGSSTDDGLGGGAISAIVIVLLLVLAGVAIGTVVLVFLYYKRRPAAVSGIRSSSIDNRTYATTQASVHYEVSPTYHYEFAPTSTQQDNNGYIHESNATVSTSSAPEVTSSLIYTVPFMENEVERHLHESLPEDYSTIIEKAVDENSYSVLSPYQAPARKEEDLYAQIRSYSITTISREEIKIGAHLGSGQFGTVDKGVWTSQRGVAEVAVKTLTDSANTVKFLQEAVIMAQFRHPNVVALRGVVSSGHPKMIVVELLHHGDLKEFLTSMRSDPDSLAAGQSGPKQLLNFSKHVALGMHYLASKGFVHRDLAARNILVSKNNVGKIADFGMSRDLADEDIYVSHGGMIPVRWTAPEALTYKQFSTASDVWSYGCVLYEIWSLGQKPFKEATLLEIPRKLESGYRLPPPPGCPRMLYELMMQCWHPDPSMRPEPKLILKALVRKPEVIMSIPREDVSASSQAGILGAPLKAATGLYLDLQKMYSTA